jgi:dGTPase
MKNKFYTEFDTVRLKESKRGIDYRTPFQIDRDRIIYSSEFRRLQGKTQVFLPGEYDFYRTRLTHSIETAQIGRSICDYLLKSNGDLFNSEFYIDADIVESACLSHDLGHPPFGHAGERTLNQLMKPYGGFEGNAQTLRLLTEVFYTEDNRRRGMNPTRAYLDSILKYKTFFSQLEDPENHFLYDYQEEFLNFVFNNIEIPSSLTPGKELNKFRSIECQIMDWADDTAYAVNDLVDSILGGFINYTNLSNWLEAYNNSLSDSEKGYIEEILDWIKRGKFKAKFGSQIGDFIRATSIEEREAFLNKHSNRYKYQLKIDEDIQQKAKLYKKIAVELVFQSPQLHQMEFKGDYMLKQIFNVFKEHYIDKVEEFKLLPKFTDKLIRREDNETKRARLICDYIAGMTDNFAYRTYMRLFDPNYSSFVDFM